MNSIERQIFEGVCSKKLLHPVTSTVMRETIEQFILDGIKIHLVKEKGGNRVYFTTCNVGDLRLTEYENVGPTPVTNFQKELDTNSLSNDTTQKTRMAQDCLQRIRENKHRLTMKGL